MTVRGRETVVHTLPHLEVGYCKFKRVKEFKYPGVDTDKQKLRTYRNKNETSVRESMFLRTKQVVKDKKNNIEKPQDTAVSHSHPSSGNKRRCRIELNIF